LNRIYFMQNKGIFVHAFPKKALYVDILAIRAQFRKIKIH